MTSILEQINEFFGPDLTVVIEKNDLKITVGQRTLVVQMPNIVGAESKG